MATRAAQKKLKIGDVCKRADVQPYVLRYWETEFPALAPDKTGGGQRTYTTKDIEIVTRIKELLYTEGFTIAGAKKKLEAELKDQSGGTRSRKKPGREKPAQGLDAAAVKVLKEVKGERREILTMLK